MEHVFKSLTNERVVDLVPYLKERITEDTTILVGCDSQNDGGKTIYATVIVLHRKCKGGHVLYSTLKVDRIRDRFVKLWKEVEISLEVAKYLTANGIQATYIDIDLNPDPRWGSNNVLRAAVGFMESQGYTVRYKPLAVCASYVADRLCR